MKKLILITVILLSVLFINPGEKVVVKEACAFGCYTSTCYSSMVCGHECYCQKQGLEQKGVCVTRP